MAIQPLGNNQPPNNGERTTKNNTWLKVTLIVISLGLGAYGGYNYTSMPGMISMGCAGTLFVGTIIWMVKAKYKNTPDMGIEAPPSPKNLPWTRPPEREPISEIDAIEMWGQRVMKTINILQPPTDEEIAKWLAIWVTDREPLQSIVGEATSCLPPPLHGIIVEYCRSEFALLQEEWETIFDKNTDFRFTKRDGWHLDRVLQLPCPFWKGKRMIETHALIHFPGYQYHNTNCKVGQFFDLRPSPFASKSIKRHLGGAQTLIPTGLLVMPLGIIPDSEGQSIQALCNLVATVNQFNVKKPSQLGDYRVDYIQTTAIALNLLNHVFPKQFFASLNQFTLCIKSDGFYSYVGLDENGEVQGMDTSRQLGGIAPVTNFLDPSNGNRFFL